MDAFELGPLVDECGKRENRYLEFIRKPSMSVGLYMLAAGAVDGQSPDSEDEIYYVISGRGFIRVGDENQAVQAGPTVLVDAQVEQGFQSITEDKTIVVAC